MSRTDSIDLEGSDGGLMSGVFRWKASHVLRSLPPLDSKMRTKTDLDYENGWASYFSSRCSTAEETVNMMEYVQKDLSLVDCLSFPVTVTSALLSTKLIDPRQERDVLNIVAIGCSGKAEERVLRETSCWEEIRTTYHRIQCIHLYMVGPEMSKSEKNASVSQGFKSHTFRGTSNEFFKKHKHLLPIGVGSQNNTVVVGFNCGFGNFENPGSTKYDLMHSWYGDLSFLTSMQNLPCIFTCANDYADVTGETMIMAGLLGANFVNAPVKNEFSCASTFVPPSVELQGGQMPPEYSCGNSYWYAVQGSSSTRRVLPRLNPTLARMPSTQRCREIATILASYVGRYNTKSSLAKLVQDSLLVGFSTPLRREISTDAPPEQPPEPAPGAMDDAEVNVELKPGTVFRSAEPNMKAVNVWECEQKEKEGGILSVTILLPAGTAVAAIEVYITTSGDALRIASAGDRRENLAPPVTLLRKCKTESAGAKYNKKKGTITVTASILQ